MVWTVKPAKCAFGNYAHIVDDINMSFFQNHPLLGSVFNGCLLEHFGGPEQLMALENIGGAIVGVTVLAPRRPGIWRTFVPSQAPIAPVLLSSTMNLEQLLRQLPGVNVAVEWLNQDPLYSCMPPDSLAKNFVSQYQLTTMSIDLTGQFEGYWSSRSKNLRRNIKRYTNRIDREGFERRLNLVSSEDALVDALGRYADIESSGWKGAKNTAIERTNKQGHFYADVLLGFAKSGQARIYELFFDDTLVASRICVNNDDILIILKTTFQESFSRFSPGRLLLYLLLEREFSIRQFRTLEFYTNATDDQKSWATDTRDMYHVTQYRSWAMRQLTMKAKLIRQAFGGG